MVLQGQKLLDKLSKLGLEAAPKRRGRFTAPTEDDMVKAQKVLLKNGYFLMEVRMTENEFYMLTFMNPLQEAPYYISLRYIVNDREPLLVLASFVERKTGLEVELFSDQRTFGTRTSAASRLRAAFSEKHPRRDSFWLPVFEGSPFLA